MIVQKDRNIHQINIPFGVNTKFLFISDVHWDNPKTDLVLLKKHLDQAKAEGAKVIVNGDFFCLMQGKGDPRKSKDDIRPEHNNARYLDSIVNTAVEWFEPYKDVLVFIGYGNHETSIIKFQETDILARFIDLFNMTLKPNIPIQRGGYGGWLQFRSARTATGRTSWVVHYFHGSGGGGPVTKNMIQHQRQQAIVEGADMVWMGHTHDSYIGRSSKHCFNSNNAAQHLKDQWFLQTPTYKEEYKNRIGSWHVERGAPPKPLGGCWIELHPHRIQSDNKDISKWDVKGYATN